MSENAVVKILLLDDHRQFSRLFEVYAKRALSCRVEVHAALNIDQAEEKLRDLSYSLLVIDNYINGVSSSGTALQRLHPFHSGPILLLSGQISDALQDIDQVGKISAKLNKDELSKPIFAETLQRLIKSLEMRNECRDNLISPL